MKDRTGDAGRICMSANTTASPRFADRARLRVLGRIAALDHLFEAHEQLRNPVGVVFGQDGDRPAGEHRQRCRNGRDRYASWKT